MKHIEYLSRTHIRKYTNVLLQTYFYFALQIWHGRRKVLPTWFQRSPRNESEIVTIRLHYFLDDIRRWFSTVRTCKVNRMPLHAYNNLIMIM